MKLLDLNKIQCDRESLQDEDTIFIVFLPIFNIAKLVGIKKDTMPLSVDPAHVPTTSSGHGCTVNLKGDCLLEDKYGINFLMSECGSQLSYGTIRRLCISVNFLPEDAMKLYENLKAMSRHFAMSPKNTKLLKNALDTLKMKSVHVLNQGSTRITVFLDACIQASSLIVPFLATVVTCNIREEGMFVASPKGDFLLQVFADLPPVLGR